VSKTDIEFENYLKKGLCGD